MNVNSTEEPGAQSARVTDAARVVLNWARLADPISVTIQDIPGTTSAQVKFLTRLSALIIAEVDPENVPRSLVEALRPAGDLAVPASVREGFRELLEGDPISSLASLYAETVSASNRRELGTFFTPRVEATSMVREYAQRFVEPEKIVDIGAGVGVFSEAASAQWPHAAVSAVDVNPVTLGLQAVALASRPRRNTTLFLSDYASWLEEYRPTGPTLYLGNPPYTRWQLIPPDQRDGLLERTAGLVDSRANLSTLFLAMTLKRLRGQDGLCLIIPAGWMSARYARHLRAYVRAQSLRPVTLRLADSWRFESAIVDAVVVQIGPERPSAQPLVTTDWPGTSVTQSGRGGIGDQSPFRRLATPRLVSAGPTSGGSTRLGDVATVTRGTATGANGFFVLSERQAAESGIDQRWLTPIVRRLRPGATPAHPAAESALILALEGFVRGNDEKIDNALDEAEAEEVHLGYLCALRRRWFDLSDELQEPDVVLSALSRERFHVYENVSMRAITNNLFGLRWHASLSDESKNATLAWLRSEQGQGALIESASVEANGLRRLSPRALGEICMPFETSCRALNP